MRPLLPLLARCFLLALLWASISTSALAVAHDHITQRAYWEDASGQASVEQARTQTLTPYDGVLSRGYTTSAIWVQLHIDPEGHQAANDKLVLRIRPIYLDEITLYDPLDTSGQVRQTGDQISYSAEEFKSLSHTFVVPAGTAPRMVWLRLKATSTTLMHIEALSIDEMQIDEHRLLVTYYSVLALILVFLLVVLINWINYREFLYAAFVARNVIYFIYAGAFFGFHRYLLSDHIDAHTIDYLYNWLIVGTTAFSFWFETRFLSEYAPPRWAKNIFYGMYFWSLTSAVLLASGRTNLALWVNMMLNGAGILILLLLSILFIDDHHKADGYPTASLLKKKFVVGYYLILTALLTFSILPYLGSMAGSEFSANGLVYYALISGLVMTLLLQLRANQMRKAHRQFEQALLLSQQQVEFEKIRREEQSQMLTMLMHELKNPLAVIDLAQQTSSDADTQDYVTRNVSIIRNVLDQCLSADRLSDGKLTIQKQPWDVIELVDDAIEQYPELIQRVVVSSSGAIKTIHTDYECLHIVLNNLLQNALRYGDADQPIEVSIDAGPHPSGVTGACITVSNKPGIASWPDNDKVFQKYYRSTGAKSISGTGLGLFLVRSICTLLGGTCTYEPDDTHVRFKVWLPN
jgi:signal transduction histidine kinase